MKALIRTGHRLAMELAVALEVASARLKRARGNRDYVEAADFNRRLWQTVRRLAVATPCAEEREAMLAAAQRAEAILANGPEGAVEANATLAGVLAGYFSCNGALRQLLDAWNHHRAGHPGSSFDWCLLDRLDGDSPSLSVS